MIHSGQILIDNVNVFEWLRNLDKQQRRSKKAAMKKSGEDTPGEGTGKDVMNGSAFDHNAAPSSIWLHCLIGEEIKEGEEDEVNGGRDFHSVKGRCVSIRDVP